MIPEVSVMMPAKDAQKFIGAAIDSILNQTCRNWELIIVDDQSKDSTGAVAREYSKKDRRIKVVSGDGICSGNARNKAISIARGRYVMNMDADDVSAPERMEKLLQAASKYELSVIGSNVKFCDEQLQVRKISNYPLTDSGIRAGFSRKLNRLTIMPGTIMISAEIFTSYKYNEFYKILTDWDLILRLGEDQRICFENIVTPLYYYRRHGASMTLNAFPRAKYNLLVRYNEKRRRSKLPEITSLEQLEEVVSTGIITNAGYRILLAMKIIQNYLLHSKEIVRFRR